MARFRDWLRAEVAAVLRPELDAAGQQVQRAQSDATHGLREEITRELDQTRQEMIEQRVMLNERTRLLVDALEALRAQLDTEHNARRAEVQAVLALQTTIRDTIAAIAPKTATRSSVHGGWIDPALASSENDRHAEIDLTESIRPGDLVDARSRFDDTWFDGLEVTEIVPEAHGRRYRLTRRSDGRTLPMLFDVVDLRASTEASDGAESRAERPLADH